jgi:Tfp pilus assembly protein PilE
MGDNRRGFTRLGLLIVVAIAATLLAVSLAYVHSRMKANEATARDSLHTLNLALYEYWTTWETYPTALANLGPGPEFGLTSSNFLDPVLASGKKSGYVFAYVPGELDFDGTTSTFTLTARPTVAGLTGHLNFSMDQTGVVHVVTNPTVATSSATP